MPTKGIHLYDPNEDRRTMCGYSVCGCGCWGNRRIALEDLDCSPCLVETIRREYREKDLLNTFGELLGAVQPA